MTNLSELRREYSHGKLILDNCNPNPVLQFQKWFEQITLSGIPDSTAMVLSTASKEGIPSSRIVLLKEYSDAGFTFFSNYNSHKGQDLQGNPNAALLFAWHFFDRQVRIGGQVEKVSESKSDEYFENRPTGSRIGAWTSPQSQVIPSREYLEEREKKFQAQFNALSIPRPDDWGGYIVIPEYFEFWQGRANRLHDRIEYRRNGSDWKRSRLAP